MEQLTAHNQLLTSTESPQKHYDLGFTLKTDLAFSILQVQ